MATHSRGKIRANKVSGMPTGLRTTTMLRLGDYTLPGKASAPAEEVRTMYIRLDHDKLAELVARAMRSPHKRVAMAGGAITVMACAKDTNTDAADIS